MRAERTVLFGRRGRRHGLGKHHRQVAGDLRKLMIGTRGLDTREAFAELLECQPALADSLAQLCDAGVALGIGGEHRVWLVLLAHRGERTCVASIGCRRQARPLCDGTEPKGHAPISCAVVNESLWNRSAAELLARASSADPTPGGGSVAAVSAAFGFALVLMAIRVTLSTPELAVETVANLSSAQARIDELQHAAVAAVDRDVTDFDAVMAAYRLPRETEPQRQIRAEAIDAASVTATHGPLGLGEAAIAGIELVDEIEFLIKQSIVSDAQAGRDILRGAALAALRTADINLGPLEQRGHVEAADLRQRRDAVAASAARAERDA